LLLEGMARHAGGVLQPVDSTAGLHVSALLPKSIDARRLVEAAAREGLAMQALHAGRGRPSCNGIAFGLGLVRDDRIDAGMRLLASLLRSHA
jgi:DNA-binding transcriptional MocR family regulator